MINTTDEAREYFKPLTYVDLTEKNFNKLIAVLEEELGKWNKQVLLDREKNGHDNRYYMTIHPHKKYGKYAGTRYEKDCAFIIVKCDNYSVREGISFNRDGFIGFAGWSDSGNVRPFLYAFEKWVDLIKAEKQMQEKSIEDILHPVYNYRGSFEELPEDAQEYDLVYHKDNVYLYFRNEWIPTYSYQPDPLTEICDIVNKAKDSKLKRDLIHYFEERAKNELDYSI